MNVASLNRLFENILYKLFQFRKFLDTQNVLTNMISNRILKRTCRFARRNIIRAHGSVFAAFRMALSATAQNYAAIIVF